jgi:serine/threonine protein kinase
MRITTGSRIGPYEVTSPLGEGGMGEVWKARDTRLGRDVAVKVLPAEFVENSSRRDRFEHEARAVAALNHPNILALYDIGSGNGTAYMVTELCSRASPRSRKWRRTPLSRRMADRWRTYAREVANPNSW